jgi:hypothetical protein
MAILLGMVVIGTIGGFFLYVAIIPLIAISTLSMALIFMFMLGVQAGRRRIRVARRKAPSTSKVLEWKSLPGVRRQAGQ